ncbi:MAG: amylo-alpha-1,6-glucosidase [Candidatus Nanohalobium sp.]
MKYNLSENLSERKGVISNLHGFLNRHLDGGFKTKWSGYWAPPVKYLDYFSFKINGIWLNKETLQGIEYGEKIIYYHETGSLSVEEHISAPDQLPGLKVELKLRNKEKDRKAVHAVLETGVDIRHKSQDVSNADYSLKENSNRINISSKGKNLVIKSDKAFELNGDSYTKEHYPGEEQRCFVPGEVSFREEVPPETKKSIGLEFLTSDGSFKSLDSRSQELRNRELGRTFNYSIESMENLIYDREGPGIIAGHPWFQEYWARDSFWTLLGLIDAGYFEISKEILENFAEKGLKSKIELEDGSSDGREREDTAPLFIIAADKLRRHYEISEEIEKGIDQALELLETDEGVVQHSEDATWMDTVERSPAVDIQGLWLEALGLENDERSEEVAEGLERFKNSDYMKDYLGEDSPETINPAVPLMFGQLNEEEAESYLEKINGEFSSNHGARTRSITDPGYRADGYHEGSVWGLTTMWAAAANLEYGREVEGRNYLGKMTDYIDRNQPGALPEVVNAENGDLIGCSEQAWSAGLYVHVVDSYLLGIQVKEDKVVIDPVSNFSGKRFGKRIGEEVLDLNFDNGEVEVMNDPDIEVEIRGENQ